VAGQPGIDTAEVEIVWDEAWTTDRLSKSAVQKLQFLPAPTAIPDRTPTSPPTARSRPGTRPRRPPMIGDAFVFDGVAHPFNFTPKNAFGRPGEMFANHLYAFHQVLTPDTEPKLSAEEYLKDWTPPTSTRWSTTTPTPTCSRDAAALTDLFRDGLSPWEDCAELAARDPERTVFWAR